MDAPLVSVITPVRDAAGTLPATVASVRAQTRGDWEMLLIDDGSTDGSAALAAGFAAADPRIQALAQESHLGTAAARNRGIAAARGRYVAFLDADDLWRPEKLARQLAFMAAGGHVFAFSAYRRMDEAGRPLGVVGVPARVGYEDLLRDNVIGCLTAIYDARALGPVEMPPLVRRQDFGLWLRLLKLTPHAHGQDEVLADYRVRPGSLSRNKFAAARDNWRLYREVEALPPARAAYYFLRCAGAGLLKARARAARAAAEKPTP
ncbi:glycosyltransferase family 2 protein [Amaricoccus sp.]|uniref:glycosyltransferase family 2 protein n=1 Tax=Amaricoccus sp. TaxID=1872485 RepID=UPI002604F790|nr:glycosyltransferase family 2 protein [uncultured Amaricoccus sp.]